MNMTMARIHQLCQMLKEHSSRTLFPVTQIEAVPCGYKTSNIPPESGWKSMSYFSQPEEHFWLRGRFSAPAAKEGKRYLLSVQTGANGWDATNPQGLIYLNGYMAQGLDTNHTLVHLEPNKVYDLHIYFYTGDIVSPMIPAISVIEQDIQTDALYWDFLVPLETLELLNENTSDFQDTCSLLSQAADLLDLRTWDSPAFHESVKSSRDFLYQNFYQGLCKTTDKPLVHALGHTHIDVEWRWDRLQTREKTQRSFATVTGLMKQYPEYRFTMSQPNLYEYLKEEAPEKYEEIKELIKEGRWEAEGAMYVEPDCNLTSGESLVRQLLHGKKFFKEEFDVDSQILFLPDVFGYSGALPQILKKSGINYFVTSKISWNDRNTMPADSFLWEGIDGTEIYTTFITTQDAHRNHEITNHTTYTGLMTPSHVLGTWDRYQQKEYNKHVFTTYGYGDGGGGPTLEMLERQRRLAYGLPGMPVTKPDFLLPTLQAAEKEFYQNAAKLKQTPRWVGELYLEFHRGTYTSIAKVKRNNRKSEFLLQKCEALSMLDFLHGGNYDAAGLYNTWTLVLHNQFHDILPGSSIGSVYDFTDQDYAKITQYGNSMVDEKLKALANQIETDGGILVFNSLGFARGGNILVNGKTIELTETIPAFGWKVLTPSTENYVIVTDNTLENNHYIISLDETGRIISLFDKKAARELVKPGGKMNEFQAYDDHPYCYDAWEISPYYKNNCYLLEEPAIITPVTDGSRSGFKIIKKYMDSTITQYIWLYTHSRRIDFDNEIDWHQKHQLLKIAFPLDIHTNNATYEIQYGHVTRPTHSNTSWDEAKYEVCAHKWADLSEKGYGVSLLNDCKYGYSTEGSTIKLTALKCASYPYPQADEGKHIFSFALLPHSGDLYDSGIIPEAYSFNQPLDTVLLDEQHGCLPDTFSLVSCDAPNVIIETVKKAEDGDDMIVRLYEAWDSRGPVTLTVNGDFKGVRLCNLIEEDMKELEFTNHSVVLPIKNFEIVTLRFVR